jgi:hypothetical protein
MKKREKKGLSTIFIVLIILSILAITGVLLFLFKDEIFETSKDVPIYLKIQEVSVQNESVFIDVKRKWGEGELVGIKFILSDGNNSESTLKISKLNNSENESFILKLKKLTAEKVKSISISPLFKSSEGIKKTGSVTDIYVGEITYNSEEEIIESKNEIEDCIPYSKQTTCGTWTCGYKANNCGLSVNCGTCLSGKTCQQGNCITLTCTPSVNPCGSKQCGIANNGTCGNISCGICPSGKICQMDGKCISTSENNCESSNYKMAFILVENSENLHTQQDIDKIILLKQKTSEEFALATKDLSSIDTNYPLVILNRETTPPIQEITKEFYKENPDDFHFLTIFSTYDTGGIQYHIPAKNNINGIGGDIYDATTYYGSEGILLGINWMKDIDMYQTDGFYLILGVNGILHETSHQWGAFIDFIDENGQRSDSLRNPYNIVHWDKKLETGYDLLNGFSWIDNRDGTFTAKATDGKRGYSNLDLYLMGLISKDEVDSIKLIVSDTDTAEINPGTTISGTIKIISIQQIIDAEGERECVENIE